jgi:hypothetical protein
MSPLAGLLWVSVPVPTRLAGGVPEGGPPLPGLFLDVRVGGLVGEK